MYWAKLSLALLLLTGSGLLVAVDKINIALDTAWLIDDIGITGKGIQLSLALGVDKLTLQGSADRLNLPAPYGVIEQVRMQCKNIKLAAETFNCKQGAIQFSHPEFGKQNLHFSLKGNNATTHYQLSITEMALTRGQLKATAEIKDNRWSAKLTSDDLIMSDFLPLLNLGEETPKLQILADWLSTATSDINLTLSGQDGITQVEVEMDILDLGGNGSGVHLTGLWGGGNQNWSATFTSKQLNIFESLTLAEQLDENEMLKRAKAWLSAGEADLSLHLAGHDTQIKTAEIASHWSGLNGSDAAGEWVAEGLSAAIQGKWQQQTGAWQFVVQSQGGQVYGEPVFLDFAEHPISLSANGKWDNTSQQLDILQAKLIQKEVIEAQLSLKTQISAWQNAIGALHTSNIDMARLYEIWMQPFLISNAAGKMRVSGKAQLNLNKTADNYDLNLVLNAVSATDEADRFRLHDLSGNMAWTTRNQAVRSTLHWQGGQLYAIPFGETTFQIESWRDQLQLSQPSILPILDGALTISQFNLARPLDESTKWSFAAALSPISMPLLSEKLGWPSLSGKLSGNIPEVAYQHKKITMDGDLSVNLFDGQSVIQDLTLDDPFGALPQLFANIDMTGLDLSILTETFDFGDITGKLDGYIHDLRLSNWKAVAFDAKFATPQGDKHRRRISQQAVEQLTEVGGGPSAALSKSFLRFFEDFSYQKMGLSCKLRNNVCDMSGVGDTATGYYIVKGGGLPPRINIVGFTRRVDWTDLLARLKAVSESDGPIIE